MIDSDANELTIEGDGARRVVPLSSRDAFVALSRAWLRVGWT